MGIGEEYFYSFILCGGENRISGPFLLFSMLSWSKKKPELCVRHLGLMYYVHHIHTYVPYVSQKPANSAENSLKARTSLSICNSKGKLGEGVNLKPSCTSLRVVSGSAAPQWDQEVRGRFISLLLEY